MKTTGNYLKQLNESGGVVLIMISVVRLITIIVFRIMMKFQSKKIDKNLSSKISEITKKNYTVVVIKEKEPNAFCYNIFKQNLYITTGLIKLLKDEREIIAVLLHESGHMINKDILRGMLQTDGSLWIFSAIFAKLDWMAMKNVPGSSQGGVLYASILMAIFVLCILGKWLARKGRQWETRADVYTVQFGYGKDLIKALKKLDKYVEAEVLRISKDNPDFKRQYEEMKKNDVHPETKDRVNKLLDEIELWKAIVSKNFGAVKKIIFKVLMGKEDLKK